MKQKMKKQIIFGSIALVAIILIALGSTLIFKGKGTLKPDAVKTVLENYINANLMAPGATAKIESVTKENGLYKVMVNIGSDQKVESYATLDGKLFFPQAMKTGESTEAAAGGDKAANTPATPENLPKTDKPVVELFVMSYCPYGTQMEKGILPAVAALGNKINFSIKFNDYAMHGEKELKENLVQYCIQKEQTAKFSNYLTCFLKDSSQSDACVNNSNVDKDKLDACIAKTDKTYSVTDNFKANKDFRGTYPGFNVQKEDNAKYNVGGSPTLVINGTEAQSGRDSASLLKTICAAFNNQPKECQTSLSSTAPAPGFGEGAATSGGSAAAGCAQ
jgi:hypothetical protein